jgi:hypothetical protein
LMPTADIGARIGPVVGLVRTVIDQQAQQNLVDSLSVLIGRLDPTQALEAFGAVQAELIKPSNRGTSAPPLYLMRGVIAELAAKLRSADIDREIDTRVRSLLADAAALPPMPAFGDPPARHDDYWNRRYQMQTVATMAAALAGAAPPGVADSLLETLRLKLRAPLMLQDIYYLLAPKLRDPVTAFDAALAEAARPAVDPTRDQSADWAEIAVAVARALPSEGAADRIEKVIALVEVQQPGSLARRPLSDIIVQYADKLAAPDAAPRFDRLVQDLSASSDPYQLFDFAQAAIALARRLDPTAAAPRLLHLIEVIAQVQPYPGMVPNQGYIPVRAFAVVTAAVARVADSAGAAAALDDIGALLTRSPNDQSRIAVSEVAAELTSRLDNATRLALKPLVLYALQRSQRPLETASWTRALVPILQAETPEAFAADVVEVWKYPNAADAADELFARLHAARSDVPDLKAGPSGYVKWIAQQYPKIDLSAPPVWLASPGPPTGGPAGG